MRIVEVKLAFGLETKSETKAMQKSFKEALLDAWDAMIPMVGLNLIWLVMTVLVVTAFPAAGGLYYATNRIAHGKSAGIGTFFDGFKQYFWISWKWGLLNLLAYFLLVTNIWFYGQFEGTGFFILQSLFFSLTIIYTCTAFYIFPFLLEQESPVLKVALRNSFLVFLRFLGRSFLFFLLLVALAVISVFIPPFWFLITVSLMAYIANWQTLWVIRELRLDDQEKKLEPSDT